MKIYKIALSALFTVLLFGCGGGGGGGGSSTPAASVISGTAAAGAPVVGIVTIRDSSTPVKEKTTPIDATGKYSVDVSGMTAPFMLRAEGDVGGRHYSMHSGALQTDVNGTINITPLTDLVMSNIAGQIAANLFANNANFASSITAANLQTEQAELRTLLGPVLTDLGLSATIDLLRITFNADHTGVDALLDALRITTDPATASALITNIVNNSVTVDSFATADAGTGLVGSGTASGLSTFDQINAQFKAWTNAFATALPATTTLDPLFDQSNFLFEGENLATFLTNITTDPTFVGIQFTNVVIEQLDTASLPNSARVRFEFVRAGSVGISVGMVLSKASSTANWLLQGDQRVGASAINAIAQSSANSNGCNPGLKTGIWLEVDALADANVDYAIVTGPGLPPEGVLLFKGVAQNKFDLMPDGGTYEGVNTTTVCNHNRYFMDDTQIAAIPDNSVYTIQLFDDGGTLPGVAGDAVLHTYTSTLRKAPVLNVNLSGANFAALTSNNLSSVAQSGGTLDVAWTLPAGMFMEGVHVFRNLGALGQDTDEFNVPATATSLSKPLAAATGKVVILNSGLNLMALDAFGREYATHP
jgi:hypothetical protein